MVQGQPQSYVSEYLDYYTKYSNIYNNICILMQVGSFYEIVQVENEKENIGNARTIAHLLNIQLTKKNKKVDKISRSNPLMCGIPIYTLKKYINVLLDQDYTVIIVDQISNNGSSNSTKRKVSYIYSPGAPPIDEMVESDSSNVLISLFIDFVSVKNTCVGVTLIDLTTGELQLTEFYSNETKCLLDEIYTVFQKYRPTETILTTNGTQSSFDDFPDPTNKYYLCDLLELNPNTTYINSLTFEKEYYYSHYQNEFLLKIYSHAKSEFGLLSPLEYFELERMGVAVTSFILISNFIHQHNETLLSNLMYPKLIIDSAFVVLPSSTSRQLNILPSKDIPGHTNSNSNRFDSLFSVLNKVSTVIGKRKLKSLLVSPLTDSADLELRYSLSEEFFNINIQEFEKLLADIYDFQKLHRKMSLMSLHPYEFVRLHSSYMSIQKIFIYLDKYLNDSPTYSKIKLSKESISKFNELTTYYQSIFDIKEMEKYNLNETASTIGNYFIKGQVTEIDDLINSISTLDFKLEKICQNFSEAINGKKEKKDLIVRLTYSDNDGYSLVTTNARANVLKKWLETQNELQNYQFKTNKSETKITSSEIEGTSRKIIKYKEQLQKLIKQKYLEIITTIYTDNKSLFEELVNYIELIDITKANVKCAKLYKYSKPIINKKTEDSFINVKGIRHPIIERLLTDTEYIPNDLELSTNNTGIVLYGLNAGGKSSLLRAVGLCCIMAQCGFYIPCDYFEFNPFKTIVSQVDLHDNIWKGQSSFVTEMLHLKSILKRSDSNTLVLADELCKGSEVVSATSIFASSVDLLSKNNVKFIFTTHLHKVAELDCIKKLKNIRIAHLSVEITKDKKIVFCRKLKEGPSQSLYGLEVAKALNLDKSFIHKAFEIRNELIGKKKEILSTKKSKYNTQKFIDECEICGYYPKTDTDLHLHTHHIDFQCNADDKGFIKHFHKNTKFNLITLCAKCHENVHLNKIEINGYKQTTNGLELDYT